MKTNMKIHIRLSILSAILFLLSTASIAAPTSLPDDGTIGTLTGTVSDKADGKPIIGATIAIPDIRIGAITDANGHYTLNHLPKGVYLVQVSYLGYATFNQKVDFT